MSPESILSALAWSLAGFVVGYGAALATVDLHTIKTVVAPSEEDSMPSRGSHFPSNRVIGVFVVLMSIITVISLVYDNQQQGKVLDCQAKVNEDLVAAVQARAVIADDDRHAVNDLVLALASSSAQTAGPQIAIQRAAKHVVDTGGDRESLDALTMTIAQGYAGLTDEQAQAQRDALAEFVASIRKSDRARAAVQLPTRADYKCGGD